MDTITFKGLSYDNISTIQEHPQSLSWFLKDYLTITLLQSRNIPSHFLDFFLYDLYFRAKLWSMVVNTLNFQSAWNLTTNDIPCEKNSWISKFSAHENENFEQPNTI
jgi:hypothetical protein